MKVAERRKDIVNILLSAKGPVSGSTLAEHFSISRQIIVQDIPALKNSGYEIISTSQGYVMQRSPLAERVFKLYHDTGKTADELATIVALGGTVVNVFVEHQVYGKIEATLNIISPRGIDQFLEGVRSGNSTELMRITGGDHYHTVRAESEEILDQIELALAAKGYLVREA